ncbi:MAG: efflux transporter periplasmic adaptor subunit, partial [Bacteroidetes bacterium]
MAPPKKNATRRLLFIILGLIVLLLVLAAVGRATGLFGGSDEGIEVETA